jgi:hypothetical protein
MHGKKLTVSLDKLARQLAGDDRDAGRVAWFADQVIGAAGPAALTADGLCWHLQPNDYQDRPEYRAAVSPRLDRVLVHADPGTALIRWITPRVLSELGLSAGGTGPRKLSGPAVRRDASLIAVAEMLAWRFSRLPAQGGPPGGVALR